MVIKVKSRWFCVVVGYLFLKFVELVGLSFMNLYDNGILIKFVGKMIKYVCVCLFGGICVSCMVILFFFGIIEFYIKLVEVVCFINLGYVGVISVGWKF